VLCTIIFLSNHSNRSASIAKIYYGRSIADEGWDTAHYMAPITGAVLSKVLNDYVIDYPILHPRYQPFTVVEKDSGNVVLNSSNSDDFVWSVFRKLADMYVAIDPILAPKKYSIELSVENVERDVERLDGHLVLNSNDVESGSGEPHERKQNVANYAAQFYHKLYSCIDAFKTGDHSAYVKTLDPTSAPSTESPSKSPTAVPSKSPTSAPTAHATPSPTSAPTVHVTAKATETSSNSGTQKKKTSNNGNTNKNETQNVNSTPDATNSTKGANGAGSGEDVATYYDDDKSENDDDGVGRPSGLRRLSSDVNDIIDNIEAELNNDDPETIEKIDTDVLPFVDDANEAAEEAEKAAEEAKEAAISGEDNKAAAAAEHAAEAAKKAAQATADAAAEASIESILSGNGDLMTNIISTCFSDPTYGISTFTDDAEGETETSVTTNAYLYVDGSHYYRLNLTAPFVTVTESARPLPKVNLVPQGKGDVVDIGLAFGIIGGFCFGIIVMLHHIRVLDWDRRLQFRWFFHPTKESSKRGGYSNTPLQDTADDDSLSLDEPHGNVELSRRRSVSNGTIA